MALTCTVEGPNSPTFSIIWFRRRNNRDEELQDSQQRVDIYVTVSPNQGGTAQFTRRGSRLSLSPLNEVNDVGQYWCQVRLENGTLFQEKSNILTLSAEEEYQYLSPCGSLDDEIEQMNCLQILQIMGPSGIDGDTSTTAGSVVLSMSSVKPENNSQNPTAVYILLAVIVVFTTLIILLMIVLAILLRCNTSSEAPTHEDMDNGHLEQQEVTVEHQSHALETSPVNQNETVDVNENIAYHTMGKIKLNENISYATNIPHRPATAPEYMEIKNDNI